MYKYELLSFDSKLFGYKVAKITSAKLTESNFSVLLSKLSDRNVRLVYWPVSPKDKLSNAMAISSGGLLADEKIVYFRELGDIKEERLREGSLKSYLGQALNKRLLSLALQSGRYSRFSQDPNFKNNEFKKLYKKWIEKSLNGEIAFEVLVWIEDGKEVGLITLEPKDDYGNIGLLAVDEGFRKKGIGRKLVKAALVSFKKIGFSKVKVSTQLRNKSACRFYEKMGFKRDGAKNIYHFWI